MAIPSNARESGTLLARYEPCENQQANILVANNDGLLCIKIEEKLDPARGCYTKTYAFLEPKNAFFLKKRHLKCEFSKKKKITFSNFD